MPGAIERQDSLLSGGPELKSSHSTRPTASRAATRRPNLSCQRLDALVAEATVDAYGDDEQLTVERVMRSRGGESEASASLRARAFVSFFRRWGFLTPPACSGFTGPLGGSSSCPDF